MLNISRNRINQYIDFSKYSSLEELKFQENNRLYLTLIKVGFLITFVFLMLPWTQNIRSNGTVTTFLPSERPQSINSIIAGRVEDWKIMEGQLVKKGDTLLILSEVKDAYFDNQLLQRTEKQVDLKKKTAKAYDSKSKVQSKQLSLLTEQKDILLDQNRNKLQQIELKIQNDSADYVAALLQRKTADYQLRRMDSLYQYGLKSLTDLEQRRIKAQEAKAYEVSAYNKWMNTKNEKQNLLLENLSIQTKLDNEINKILSDQITTQTSELDANLDVAKLENQYANYKFRNGLYIITAPQDGFITKTFIQGIGEMVKEGQPILSFMPRETSLALEVFIDPIDVPLINKGQEVRMQFDGWPAVVFSGWPDLSIGTYVGKVYAMDQFASQNGKFRVLVRPSDEHPKWPDALRFGGGAKSIILLKDVPIWYELWRQVNGFPPDFYEKSERPFDITDLQKEKK